MCPVSAQPLHPAERDGGLVGLSRIMRPLGTEKGANYVVQSMRCKMLSYCLAPAIAVWTSGENPSNPEKDKAIPNQVLLFPRHHDYRATEIELSAHLTPLRGPAATPWQPASMLFRWRRHQQWPESALPVRDGIHPFAHEPSIRLPTCSRARSAPSVAGCATKQPRLRFRGSA